MRARRRLWIDVINPSDVFFFGALLRDLADFPMQITFRKRAETEGLARSLGMRGTVVGSHYTEAAMKPFGAVKRVVDLNSVVGHFDYGLSFENPLSVALCKFRGGKSVLFCDNDLKLIERRHILLNVDNLVRTRADMVIVPEACAETMASFVDSSRLTTYDGYKEDVYIADYKPDPNFNEKLGLGNYVVVRPEALGSTYVRSETSIATKLLHLLRKENLQVVYLPRDKHDYALAKGIDVIVPDTTLSGLDLCYYSDAVLTGSGTMAREAACMGKPAVSFFPNDVLLSVDQRLVDEGRILHTRNPDEIMRFVTSKHAHSTGASLERSKRVKSQLTDSMLSFLNR